MIYYHKITFHNTVLDFFLKGMILLFIIIMFFFSSEYTIITSSHNFKIPLLEIMTPPRNIMTILYGRNIFAT